VEKKEKSDRKQKKQQIMLSLFAVILLILLLILCLLTCRPKGYKPLPQLSDSREVSPYLTHYLVPDFHKNIQLDKPFEIIITQKGINDILSRHHWPVSADGVKVSMPYVQIKANQIKIMATVKMAALPMVAAVVASPEMTHNAKLKVRLKKVSAGKLNITVLAVAISRKMINQEIKAIESSPYSTDFEKKVNITLWKLFVKAVLDGEPVEPVFPTIRGKTIKLSGIEMAEEKLVLRFDPL
jgi:hypothetical protein